MKKSKRNSRWSLQDWMDSMAGQTFLNYAYSWGAAIVILGALFKLTHLEGANFFLFLGMGTEVFVFFISAFDRPFSKTSDDSNLQKAEDTRPAGVDDEQIQSARRRMIEMEEINTSEEKRRMAASLNEQTKHLMNMTQQLSEQLEDNKEAIELKNTLNAIQEVYRLQLSKASSQMTTVEEIDRQLHFMAANLEKLNKVYARMIDAVNNR